HLIGLGKFHDADAADLRMGADFGDGLIRRLVIEIEDGDGFAASHLPAHGHLSDVYMVLAEDRADEADQPRHITVREDEHDPVHETIEVIRPNLHEPEILVAEKRAGGSVCLLLSDNIGPDERAEIAFLGAILLDDFNATLPSQKLSVDD